jgi:hypothetical protein
MTNGIQGLRLTITRGFASPASVDVWKGEATIGRSPEATLRFDPQRDTAIARGLHARLLWEEDAWWIECLHDSGLGIVDGDRVTNRIPNGKKARIVTPATFEVGAGGPRFEVVSLAGTLPATEVNPVDDLPVSRVPYSTLTQVHSTRKRTAMLAAGVLLVSTFGLIVAMQLNQSDWETAARIEVVQAETAEETRRVLADLTAVKGDVGALAERTEDRLGAALLAASESVWLVGLVGPDGVFTSVGTAWTCSPNQLATNAHVAVALRDGAASPGTAIVARRSQREGDDSLTISKSMMIHPAYEPWSKSLQSQFLSGPGGSIRTARFIPPGDVAVLEVTEGDPGAPLRLASTAAMTETLRPGAPVGYVGYPMENVVGLPTLLSPTGRITALTNFFFENDSDEPLLVHHDAVATGGASGSPLITEDGEVVALVSAGNVVAIESPSGSLQRVPIGLNYAQHIRLLHELLDGTATENQRLRDPSWQDSLERLTLSPDGLLDRLMWEKGISTDRAELVDQQVLELGGSGTANAQIIEFSQDARATYVILAVSHDRSDIDLVAIDAEGREIARDDAYDWHPLITIGPVESLRRITVGVVVSEANPSERTVLSLRVVKATMP